MGQLQTRVRGGGIAGPNPNRIWNPIPVRIPDVTEVRDFCPRRLFYTRAQKERAVRLLSTGTPFRQVTQMIGPRCCSGSPIRWRQQARREEEARRRRRLDEMMRHRAAH